MSRIYPLFSSSRGNATYIGTAKSGLLIDAGVSCRRLDAAMQRNGLSLSAIQAVFITHDHSDHIGGVEVLTRRLGVPVYAQERTLLRLCQEGRLQSDGVLVEPDVPQQAANMEVVAFPTPHDALDSCGYRVTMPNGTACAVCTDLGYVTQTVENHLTGCELVLLESNYDEDMLRKGPYPASLKRRIRSDRGHLSNRDCGRQAERLVKSGVTRLILGHLSQENNTPDVAAATVQEEMAGLRRGRDYLLEVAPVETQGMCVTF